MSAYGEGSGFYAHPSVSATATSSSSTCSRCPPRTKCGCKRYPAHCPPRHTYPTPTPSSSISIETDNGRAFPNAHGVIEFGGACNSGLMTMTPSTHTSTGICNRVEFQNLRDVTPYVVNNDPDNGNPSQYSSLHDALVAASEDPISNPCEEGGAVIILTPSKFPYILTEALSTDRRISVTAVSTSGGTAFVESDGMVESYGNKSWAGVTFRGDCTHYHLTSTKTKPQVQDKFNSWSEFRENAKVSTDNHKLVFRNVFFNHGELSRDAVLEADGGCGVIDACFCKFNICRCGKTEARSFIRHCVDTDASSSRILHSYGHALIEGREPFLFADMRGSQLFVFEHNTFEWTRAQPEETVMFGTLQTEEEECECDDSCPPRTINGRAKLEIGHNTINSPNGENLTLIANLATGEVNRGLLVLFSHVRARHIYLVNQKVPDGQKSGLYAHNSFLAATSDQSLFVVNHSDNNVFEYRVVSSPHQTFSSKPIYQFNQSGVGNAAAMFVQAFNMLYFGGGVNPVSVEGNIDTTVINYDGVGGSGVDPATGALPLIIPSAIL